MNDSILIMLVGLSLALESWNKMFMPYLFLRKNVRKHPQQAEPRDEGLMTSHLIFFLVDFFPPLQLADVH